MIMKTISTIKSFLSNRKSLIRKSIILVFLSGAFFFSCEDFVEVDPPVTSLVGETVFEDDATANSAVLGLYSRLVSPISFLNGNSGLTWFGGLYSDELINHSSDINQVEFAQNELSSDNSKNYNLWIRLYETIYATNTILEGLFNSLEVSTTTKTQLEGEVKFVRAFCYFYLVNLFGDVPLTTSSNFEVNSVLTRSSNAEIYEQIVADLIEAKELLPTNYVSGERIRANQWTAGALLARTYLFLEDWPNAELEASEVINSGVYTLENDLNRVFLNDSEEAIWQLKSVDQFINTWDGLQFILTGTPFDVSLSPELNNSFEDDDLRSSSWIGSVTPDTETFYFPFKYKIRFQFDDLPPQEYLMIFRLAEQHLIRAEARVQQNNITDAQADLNVIRDRAGLPNTTASDQSSLILAIEEERRHELFTELGHRWFDLKRNNRVGDILGPIKPLWQETAVLFPIPEQDLLRNPNLTPQNPGY